MVKKDFELKEYDEKYDDECDDECDDCDFDISGLTDSCNNNSNETFEFMQGMMGSCGDQMRTAIELTKLIIEKSAKNINEEEVFSIYKKSLKVTLDNFPLKTLLEKIPGETEDKIIF